MSDDNEVREEQPVSTGLTARVADSYGDNPHEHKPSQDPFLPDDPDWKEEEWAGTNSSTSETSSESSERKTDGDSTPAPNAGSRSERDLKGSSTARSTGTAREQSGKSSK